MIESMNEVITIARESVRVKIHSHISKSVVKRTGI